MDGFTEVTDPELLQKLDGTPSSEPTSSDLKPVEDPDLIRRLDAPDGVIESTVNAGKRAALNTAAAADQWAGEAYKQRAEDYNRSFGEIMSDAYGMPEDGKIDTEEEKRRFYEDSTDLIGSGLSGLYRWGMSRINSIGETKESLEQKAQQNFDAAAANTIASSQVPRSESAQRYEQGNKEGKSIFEMAWNDPASVLAMVGETSVESAPMMAAGVIASAVTRNPSVGAAVMGGTSYLTERYSAPIDFLMESGVDISKPEELKAAVQNKELMAKAAEYGHTRGKIIGALDWLSGGLAAGALAKGPVKNFAAGMATQAGIGSAGEGLAQGETKGYSNIDWNDVALEGLAEFATAPIEMVGVGRQYLDSKNKPTTEINVEEVIGDVAAGKPGARETLVAYGIPEEHIDDMVRRRAEAAPKTETVTQISEMGADPAQAEAIAATQPAPGERKESPREFAARISKERQQRAQANQQAAAPTAAGSEPPATVGVGPAAPPVTPQANPDANTVPEAPATIEAQQQALAERKRRAVFYPDGTKPAAPPPGTKRIKVSGLGIFDYDPGSVSVQEIKAAAKAGRLNELLDLGPYNKQEVAESVSAGAPPVAVTERTPQGTEVKAAAGTTETAPAQVEALEATKAAPDNTVAVEQAETVIAGRQQKRKLGSMLKPHPGEGYRLGPFSFEFNERAGGRYLRVRDRSGNNLLQGSDNAAPGVDVTDIWSAADPNQFEARQGNKVGINSLGNNVPTQLEPVFRDWLDGKISEDEALARIAEVEIGGQPAAEQPAARTVNGRRVLEDVSPEGIAKRKAAEEARAKQEAARLAKEKAAAEEAAAAAEKEKTRAANQEAIKEKIEQGSYSSIEEEAYDRATANGAKLSPAEKTAIVNGAAVAKDVFDQATSGEMPDVAADSAGAAKVGEYLRQVVTLARNKFKIAAQEARKANKGKLTTKERRAYSIRAKADYNTVTDHNVWLSEANTLLRRLDKLRADNADESKFQSLLVDINDFLNNTEEMKSGNPEGLREKRKANSAATKAAKAGTVTEYTGPDQTIEPEALTSTTEVREEEDAAGRTADVASDDNVTDAPDSVDDVVTTTGDFEFADAGLKRAARWRYVRDRARELRGKREAKAKPTETERPAATDGSFSTPNKTTKGIEVQTKRKFTINKVLKREGDSSGAPTRPLNEADVLQEVTLAEALERSGEAKGNATNREIVNRLLAKLSRVIGDTPVLVVDQAALNEMFPDSKKGVDGYYDPQKDHIVVSVNFLKNGEFDAQLLAHEGLHAYLQRAVDSDPNLQADIQEILNYVRERSPQKNLYGFKDVHEFLSEALSNPEFQNLLMEIPVTGPMARKFDMPAGSVWKAMVNAVRKHFKFGRRDVDALSYVMRLAERAEDRRNKSGEADLIAGMRELGMLSEGRQRDYGAELKAAGVPDDIAADLHDFLTEEIGKSIDPSTLPLLMGDLINQYGKPTSQGNNPPPPVTPGAPPAPAAPRGPNPRVSAFGGALRNLAVKFNTLDYIRQTYNKYFDGLLDPYVKTIQKYDKIASDTAEVHDRDGAEFLELMRTDPKEAAEMAKLAMEATRLNIQLTGVVSKPADEKKLGIRGVQGRKRLADLNTRFSKLKPSTQALYKRMVKNYRETHNNNIRALAHNLLTDLDLKNRLSNSDLMMLIEKVVRGTLTKDDAALIGEPKIYNELRRATSLRTIDGDYFPMMRFGDFVVMTTDKIADPNITSITLRGNKSVPVKVKVEGGTVSFTVDPMAHGAKAGLKRLVKDYIGSSDLTMLRTNRRYVDRKTGKPVKTGEMDPARDYDLQYVVEFQVNGVNFFESRVDAQKFINAIKNPDTNVSEVLNRRENPETFNKLVSGSALTEITKRIDKRKDLKPWQRKQMHAAVTEAVLSQMTGNRAQARHMARRNVMGASDDVARAAITYGQAAGNYFAMLTTADDVRDSFAALEKFEGTNQYEEGAAVRSQVMNELRARQATLNEPLYLNKWFQHVATLSFLDKLAGPSHSIINFMQVIGNAFPMLGGKYGNVKAATAISNAYSKIGTLDVLGGGLKNTGKALKDWQKSWLDTTDLVGSVRKKLGPKYDRLIDELEERGLLEGNANFEIGPAVSSSGDKISITLAKLDRAARQLPTSVEVVNRIVTAVAAYDLATSQGNTIPQAIEEAYNTVSMTQGDYRKSNNPRFTGNKFLSFAMQFKKYAIMQTQLIGDLYVRSLKGASKEERIVARKQLANLMATQIMLGGAMGLPGLELIKLAVMLVSVVFPDLGWDELEEELKQILDASIGQKASELIRKGVVTRAIGVDVSSRMSQADLWSGFVPDKLDRKGLQQYFGSLILGAPGGTALDWMDGIKALADGDVERAFLKIVPIKVVADAATAVEKVNSGRMSIGEAGLKILGFDSAKQARAREETSRDIKASDKVSAERSAIYRDYINASSPGELAKIKSRVREYNAKIGKNGRKISIKSLERARQRDLNRYK